MVRIRSPVPAKTVQVEKLGRFLFVQIELKTRTFRFTLSSYTPSILQKWHKIAKILSIMNRMFSISIPLNHQHFVYTFDQVRGNMHFKPPVERVVMLYQYSLLTLRPATMRPTAEMPSMPPHRIRFAPSPVLGRGFAVPLGMGTINSGLLSSSPFSG